MGHLAWADAFVITADSVSMLSEACSTGKPVYVIGAERCTWNFADFHKSLRERGLVRPFTGKENVDAHVGGVNDLAVAHLNKQLCVVTCGDDKELEGPLGNSDAVNRELVSLERELSTLRKNGTIDSFGLYLYGLVLKEKGSENLARTVLVESVNSYPWNWNAWSELQSLCTTENLQHWLTDDKARDQFVIRAGSDTEVLWNDGRHLKPEPVYKRSFWIESFVQWSPLGTYLATVHRQGAAAWGGATSFNRLMRYAHPQVKLIDFSPGERFLVTYSSHEPSNPRDTHRVVLNIFDLRTGKVMRDFKGSADEFAIGALITWTGFQSSRLSKASRQMLFTGHQLAASLYWQGRRVSMDSWSSLMLTSLKPWQQPNISWQLILNGILLEGMLQLQLLQFMRWKMVSTYGPSMASYYIGY
ncbi:hypothetical protein F0562_016012 [Nyssa sinensis]|uniref:Cdc23 domain-containing protein n=1 Tax=Nyssa sinensis TaxID=561372 RepID=A0A5J4ZLM9_9ASTE|nr:hypothetical protein F0562_016012 [Nyssa sinensis]